MSRRMTVGLFVLLLIAALLPAAFARTAAADPQPSVIQPSDIAVANLVTHGDGSVTVTDCKNAQLNNDSTTYSAITMDPGGNVINHVPKTVDNWVSKSCVETSLPGTDNTFFVMQSKNTTQYRLSAYKNGAVRWAPSYECSNGQDLAIQAITLGADGNIYGVFYNPGTSCPGVSNTDRVLIGINAADGSEKFREVFSITETWSDFQVFSQPGLLMVKTEKRILFFDDESGDVQSSKTILAGSQSGDRLYHFVQSDDDARVYVRVLSALSPPPSACSSHSERHAIYKQEGTSAEVALTTPACANIVDLEMLPGDKFAYIYQVLGAQEWRLAIQDLSDTVLYDGVISAMSGYDVIADTFYLPNILSAGGDGYLYLKRRVKVSPAGSSDHINVRIDKVSASGVMTKAFSTEDLDSQVIQSNAAASSAYLGGLAGDKLFVSFCDVGVYYCNAYATVKVAVVDLDNVFDYPRSSIFAEHEQLNYVALGDSFSSGEGVEPFITGTDTGSNECHRSENAYSMLLDADSSLSLNLQSFRACSGATIANVRTSGQHGESKQINMVGGDTDVVTMTIGGNSAGFDPFARECIIGDCDGGDKQLEMADKVANDLPDELESLLQDVAAKLGTSNTEAKVLVVGYPRLMPYDDGTFPSCSYFSSGERVKIREMTTALNTAIRSAVQDMRLEDERFYFVGSDEVLDNVRISPFSGHELCSTGSYFHGIHPTHPFTYSAHPNEDGQQAYAELIADFLEDNWA